MSCCVNNCLNLPEDGYQFFNFPTDPNKLIIWKNAMKRPGWKLNLKKSLICEAHFEETQFNIELKLKKSAVPSIYNIETFKARQSFSSVYRHQNTTIFNKEAEIVALRTEVDVLKTELADFKNFHSAITGKGLFNSDQIQNLLVKHVTRKRWSKETVEKALAIKFTCGSSGYNYLLQLNFPLPTIRTLSSSVEHISFQPGILEECFDYLKIKVSTLKDVEKDCSLCFDEMAIVPGEAYCMSTSQAFGYETLQNSGEFATLALVVLLRGITTKWKQVVGYHFTSKKMISYEPLVNFIMKILLCCHNIGLNVISITSDMGTANQGVWNHLGITSSKKCLQNYILHPQFGTKIFFLADVPHLLKNIRTCLTNNQKIKIPDYFVRKYSFSSNIVDIKHIKNLAIFQESEIDLQIAPHLNSDLLNLDHFNKMKVANASYIFNKDISAGLNFLCDEANCDMFDESVKITAWFANVIFKWFSLLTSRTTTMAISKFNPKVYEETILFLNEVIELFYGLEIGDKAKWKPIPTGVILSTQIIIDLQNYLLNSRNYSFVLTSRFTQDGLENLFGQIRLRQSIPNAVQFRQLLKNLSVIQILGITNHGGSYAMGNSLEEKNLINFQESTNIKKK